MKNKYKNNTKTTLFFGRLHRVYYRLLCKIRERGLFFIAL
jgi:hypothetical protein